MTTSSLYQRRQSWLHSSDARVKLALTFCLMLLGLLYQSLWFLLGLLALELIMFLSGRLPWSQLRTGLRALLPVSGLMLLLRWVFYPQGLSLFSLGPLNLTSGGLAAGAVVALRILALALAVQIWLGSTSNQDVIRSLVALGLPYSWGLSFALALRFLPEFLQTYRSIEQAQRARGLDISRASWLNQIRMRQPILVAMVITSLRKSEQLAIALDARAFGSAGQNRTQYRRLSMTWLDWLLLALILLVAGILLAMRLVAGVGALPL
jgi:energy-coupling factor transport system permease protein